MNDTFTTLDGQTFNYSEIESITTFNQESLNDYRNMDLNLKTLQNTLQIDVYHDDTIRSFNGLILDFKPRANDMIQLTICLPQAFYLSNFYHSEDNTHIKLINQDNEAIIFNNSDELTITAFSLEDEVKSIDIIATKSAIALLIQPLIKKFKMMSKYYYNGF